jgi:hypothetical protein
VVEVLPKSNGGDLLGPGVVEEPVGGDQERSAELRGRERDRPGPAAPESELAVLPLGQVIDPPAGVDQPGAAVPAARASHAVLGDGHHDARRLARVVVCLQEGVGAREQVDPPLGPQWVECRHRDSIADQLEDQVGGATAARDAARTVGDDHDHGTSVIEDGDAVLAGLAGAGERAGDGTVPLGHHRIHSRTACGDQDERARRTRQSTTPTTASRPTSRAAPAGRGTVWISSRRQNA